MKQYFVYIIASKRNGTLYIGMTNNLQRRMHEHKTGVVESFSKRYGICMLVHYEQTDCVEGAIMREKQLKKWERKWKLRLIEEGNPDWKDLYDELM